MNQGLVESHVAKKEIHTEAAVEREKEATPLEQGASQTCRKARMEEIIHAIENIFSHLTGCLQHFVTPEEGNQQFLFLRWHRSCFSFCLDDEGNYFIGCICVLCFVTAPQLVREYGNLSAQANRSAKKAQATKKIVLPAKIKERVDTIVKVASAVSERRFPLRSVLIHDKYFSSQGPAELRRLITWASNKRRGGIIIIDEAESALGSRAKTSPVNEGSDRTLENGSTSSSSGFSRDCFNVLLSTTGSYGNIMLILTTSNPSDLDEAVIEWIRLSTCRCLQQKSAEYCYATSSFVNSN
mmetsp:Transcript_7597/g.13706  ORF Transcript_7597/g.13706 Transcript_7597/m.13706 type:complete len:297 (+) Transcript_7597:450-1340(+)